MENHKITIASCFVCMFCGELSVFDFNKNPQICDKCGSPQIDQQDPNKLTLEGERMTERKPIRSDEELAEAFDQLFSDIPSPRSQAEIEEYIREEGIDPEEFGMRIKTNAKRALQEIIKRLEKSED